MELHTSERSSANQIQAFNGPVVKICHKVRKGLGELQGHSRASFHRVHCERCALFDVTLEVCGLAHRYLLYKCSTRSSFLWFGMQWTYIFNI